MARIAKIGTTAFGYLKGVEACHNRAVELATTAGASKCDLLLLPELLLRERDGSSCLDRRAVRHLQEALQSLAAQHSMYIIAGLPVWEEDALYNGAVVINRTGDMHGVYKKIHPTQSEIEIGFVPAQETMVFETDFGSIGVLICYDIGWPQEWQKLSEQGAELVAWLSAYDGGFPLQAYAWNHKYYVVASVLSTEAMFADMTGSVIGKTSKWGRLAVEKINLERRIFHASRNWNKLALVQQRYGDAVHVRSITEQNVLTLEPTNENVDIDAIIAEFGLETYQNRIARNTQLQQEALARFAAAQRTPVLT